MTVIVNEATILSDLQLHKNKLSNMKDHLETLLRKKIRLESEISLLKKQIADKQKHFELQTKTKISLESQQTWDLKDPMPVWLQEEILEQHPNLHECILEFDQVSMEIHELLEAYSD